MLIVHRSERADYLAGILAGVLAVPMDDPMLPELVAVPTRGVERWLSQRLSHRLGVRPGRGDGVAANLRFPFPGSLVGAAVAAATGLDPGTDPWSPERAVWPLLEVVDEHVGDLFLKPLAGHLRASSPERDDGALTRFATVRHLADLFDQYSVHRPAMICSWAAGADSPAPHGWQSVLWRLLRERIGTASPAERLDAAVGRIASDPGLLDLPGRLSLFGLTRLPPSYLAVLRAVAAGREVHLYLLHPSGRLWERVAAELTEHPPGMRRAEDPTAQSAVNPLLRSWGRDAREMQLVLASYGASAGEYRPVDEGEPVTLLQRLQAAVRADVAPPVVAGGDGADPRPPAVDGDRSVQVHSCHGRYRQVEVLRDAVLHILEADATIEPRDVIVMCPDVEAFAPLIEAVFGAEPGVRESGAAAPELRVRLADRSLRQTNPVLAATAAVLDLAEGRLTATQALDFAGREPVRRRFLFDDDDLATLERWVMDMGARWGLDAEYRKAWKLDGVGANTWDFGLDRLLLGVAMADDDQRLFEATLPVDDVAGTDVDLAGRFSEFIARLGTAMRELSGRRPLREWVEALVRSTELLTCVAARESWQTDQMRGLLIEVGSGPSGGDPPMTIPEVRSLLANRLKGEPTRANFRTGDLTVCTLVPMRSVPHRVVCLLGLDDGTFPRHTHLDGDDVIASDPHVGDRDFRSEDRQLLLDAVMAATDHLVVTYSGRDERTNRERPPAVPIAELLDVIDRTVRPAAGEPGRRMRDEVVVEHPLQAFDSRNFDPGALGPPGPWGFSEMDLRGAEAMIGPRSEPLPFLAAPLPALQDGVISLESLVGFVKHPVQWFLRERLNMYVNGGRDDPEDALPIELDALAQWGFGDRLLRARLAGATLEEALSVERARGLLPPAAMSKPVIDEVAPAVEALVRRAAEASPAWAATTADPGARSMEVNLRLPDGRLLIGTVPGVRGATIVSCIYSRLGPKHRLEAWVRLLALAASRPDLVLSAVSIGRSGSKSTGGVAVSEMRVTTPVGMLARLVDLYDRGMREPLPLYCKTSADWAESRRAGDADPFGKAKLSWDGNRYEGESAEEAHKLVLGGEVPLATVMEALPRPDESGPGWQDREGSRFGRLAVRLWGDLLDHEHKSCS